MNRHHAALLAQALRRLEHLTETLREASSADGSTIEVWRETVSTALDNLREVEIAVQDTGLI